MLQKRMHKWCTAAHSQTGVCPHFPHGFEGKNIPGYSEILPWVNSCCVSLELYLEHVRRAPSLPSHTHRMKSTVWIESIQMYILSCFTCWNLWLLQNILRNKFLALYWFLVKLEIKVIRGKPSQMHVQSLLDLLCWNLVCCKIALSYVFLIEHTMK